VTLRDYLSVLRRRIWTVTLICALVTGAALLFSSRQKPVYEANTRLLLGATQSSVDAGIYGQYIDSNRVATEIQVILGKSVAEIVQAKLGSAPPISGASVGSTAVISLTARATTARSAADIANAYADAYIEYRQKQFTDAVSVQTKEYTRQVEALGAQIAAIEARPRPAGSPAPAEVEPLRAEQSAFRLKLQQIDSAERLNANAAAVIAPASPPSAPAGASPIRNAALGVLVGLVLGVGVALLFEHLDDSVKSKDDIERKLPQLTVLGAIPIIPGWRNRAQPRLVAATDPTSPAAEAYRTLRTSIQFLGLDRSLRVLQVTSPMAAEGKSTTLANLAVTLSHAGLRVIVVCCDLRRPRIHEFFGLSNDAGFTSVLLGQVPLIKAIQSAPGLDRVKVLASGPLPPNPSELLSSPRTTDMFKQLASQADIVLIDCPPALPVTDAAVLATKVDGTLVVASATTTTYRDLTRTMQLLNQVDAPVLGVVLNGAKSEGSYEYQYRPATAASTPSANGRGRKEAKADKPAAPTNGSRRKAS
jgi:succinoglycan biosynthesis transport protein ExoP